MRTREPKVTIVDASFHRNGIGGAGFYAILFNDADWGRMIASLFDKPGHCAVFNLDELGKQNIQFAMGNSWRGDEYEAKLRPALEAWLKEHGGNRVGPFAIPMTIPNEKEANHDTD